MHDGSIATLEEAVASEIRLRAPAQALDARDRADLVALLRALTAVWLGRSAPR